MPEANNTLPALDTMTVATACAAMAQGLAAIKAGQREINLETVKTVDSAAVSVLLAWQRAARAAGVTLSLTNLPASLQTLITLYGVDTLLADAQPVPPHHH